MASRVKMADARTNQPAKSSGLVASTTTPSAAAATSTTGLARTGRALDSASWGRDAASPRNANPTPQTAEMPMFVP